MTQNKTVETDASVTEFLDKVEDEKKRADCYTLLNMMEEVTGFKAKMWGDSIVGFGSYHYKYASGHEGDAGLTGFSPRKANLTIYIVPGFDEFGDLLKKLGKFKNSKVCLYIKSLEDIDPEMLRELIAKSVQMVKNYYPGA